MSSIAAALSKICLTSATVLPSEAFCTALRIGLVFDHRREGLGPQDDQTGQHADHEQQADEGNADLP